MEAKMFCYQCQEAKGGEGCTTVGMCGKQPDTAVLQDLLVWNIKGFSSIIARLEAAKTAVAEDNYSFIIRALFTTITNANFDNEALIKNIEETLARKEALVKLLSDNSDLVEAALWQGKRDEFLEKAHGVGILATEDVNIRSLKELITYGMKGLAAYLSHAEALGYKDQEINSFLVKALSEITDNTKTVPELTALALKCGEYGVKGMALLDKANTESYGNPEITNIKTSVGTRPGILISGHDLHDLKELLEQSKDAGIDIYTHSEMLPANTYPEFKKSPHLVGNFGGAWWQQKEDFENFRGPILLTTNCLVPPKSSYQDRLWTTGAAGFSGCKHIEKDANGHKDFSEIIKQAQASLPPVGKTEGSVVAGFGHDQTLKLADKVIAAVKSGAIKNFVVQAGCDGRMKNRQYYTDFVTNLPKDTVILTAGCAKYRFINENLGDIGGIPRVIDAGQCNDSYSLVVIALALRDAFGLKDVNDLPIVYNISWYEQKAVIVLLALLHLGVKNIHLGPTLPAFVSPAVLDVLVQNFGISGISTPENDLKIFFKMAS